MEVFQQIHDQWTGNVKYCFCYRVDDIEYYWQDDDQHSTTEYTELPLIFLREVL